MMIQSTPDPRRWKALAVLGIAYLMVVLVFSIVMVTFEEGAERNKALGILGAIAGSGAAIGVLLGGVLTEYVGWEWIFFVNVPIGVGALFFVRPLLQGR